MTNAVVATSPADQFRAKAAGVLSDASEMSLHGLLDEFVRLTNVMDENVAEDEDGDMGFTPAGELASRERRLIVVAAQARFGISFEAHDRPSSSAWPI